MLCMDVDVCHLQYFRVVVFCEMVAKILQFYNSLGFSYFGTKYQTRYQPRGCTTCRLIPYLIHGMTNSRVSKYDGHKSIFVLFPGPLN